MNGKILVRLIGAFACAAVVVSGWDAEAGWRHCRRACCCAPICEPVCAPVCEPVCAPVCAPVCEPVRTTCCEPVVRCCPRPCSYVVVEREIVVPTVSCCDGRIVAGRNATTEESSVIANATPKAVAAVSVSTSGSTPAR